MNIIDHQVFGGLGRRILDFRFWILKNCPIPHFKIDRVLKSGEQQEFEHIVKEWVQSREEASEILETALEYKGKNLGLSLEVVKEIIKKEWQLTNNTFAKLNP